jgi:hypothetical protein
VLSLPEVELMAVLDAGLPTARAAIAHVSEAACPPCHTVRFPLPSVPPLSGIRSELGLRCPDLPQALALLEERVGLGGGGRLATTLAGLDEALGGGIPPGKLTEVVGPSGIGKTQVSRWFFLVFGLNFLTRFALIPLWMYQFLSCARRHHVFVNMYQPCVWVTTTWHV